LNQVALLLSKRNQFSYATHPVPSARRAARRRLLRLRRASGCLGTSHGSSHCSSSTSPRRTARCRLLRLCCASGYFSTSRGSLHDSSSTTSTMPCVRVPRHVARLFTWLVVDYLDYATRPGASSCRAARQVTRRAARQRILRLRRASGYLGTSRGSSCGSSSTTSTTSRVRMLRNVARLVARLVVDYFDYAARPGASTRHAGSSPTTSPTPRVRVPRHVARLVVDYFDYAARPGASARCAARRAGSSSTTLPTPCVRVPQHVARLVVDYFDYAARPGASACRAAHHATRHAACRRLLHLRRASGCFSTSRGLSRDSSSTSSPRAGSSSTTSPPPRVRVPRHVARLVVDYFYYAAWLVAPLVIDYFTYATRSVASARHAACRVTHRRLLRLVQARRRLLCLRRASGCLGTSRGSSRGSSSTTSPTPRIQLHRHVARLVA
jgi:hypothetical protein